MQANVFTAPPLDVPRSWAPGRAEIVFAGVDQAGPSFEGRVFLNNARADEATPREPSAGYAGSFHVYGHGEAAPPAVAEARAARGAGDPPAAPIEKSVHADPAAVREALGRSGELTVTVVAVPADDGGPVPERAFEDVRLVLDGAA